MARTPFNARVVISKIICHDEADGPGDAEPYLWAVLFKIDGDNYVVANGLTGNPWIMTKPGHHGNLNDIVYEGDTIRVPDAVGLFETPLKPVPVIDPNYRVILGEDQPGIIGLVVVLMEQDGWPDELATTGYDALADAVRLGIAKFVTKYQHNSSPPAQEDIAAEVKELKSMASRMVRGAIQEKMSGAQVAFYGSAGNNDDQIGAEAWFVDQDQLSTRGTIAFERRWDDDESDGAGDWTIRVVFLNADAPLDTTGCARLAEQVAAQQALLEETVDLHERQQLLQQIDALQRQQKLQGCI